MGERGGEREREREREREVINVKMTVLFTTFVRIMSHLNYMIHYACTNMCIWCVRRL